MRNNFPTRGNKNALCFPLVLFYEYKPEALTKYAKILICTASHKNIIAHAILRLTDRHSHCLRRVKLSAQGKFIDKI